MHVIFYIMFVCYAPILAVFFPNILGVINSEWLLFYLLLIAFMINIILKKKFSLGGKWILTLFAYTVVVFMSITWADNYSYDLYTLQRIFARVVSPLIIAFMAMNIFENKDNVYRYMKHIIIASLVLSLICIYQMTLGGGFADEKFRATATFMNPNGLAIFLVLTIPCLIYGMEKQFIPKKIGLLVAASVMGGVICTVSRKGIGTMILVFFLYCILKKQFKNLIVLGIICSVLLVCLSGYQVISHRFTQKEVHRHFEGKANMAYSGVKMFIKNPIIGLGYRGYYENFGKYVPHSVVKKCSAHNVFVTALADYGLFGFIPFMGIFIYPLVVAVKILRRKDTGINDQYLNNMAIICIISLIPFMISAYFAGGLFYRYEILFLLYTNISFSLSKYRSEY